MPSDAAPPAPAMSDVPRGSKPPRRLWLLAPYAAVLLLLVGYGAYWFVAAGQVRRELARAQATLQAAGVAARWGEPRIDGFPFRLRLRVADARIAAASGWGVRAPALEAQAYLYAPEHWVVAAPDGLRLERPRGGEVAVSGGLIRGSVVGLRGPSRIVLQGRGLTFAPATGADPFPLRRADLLEVYLRPGGAGVPILLRLEDGRADPATLFGRLAGAGVVAGMANLTTVPGERAVSVRQARLTGESGVLELGPGRLGLDAEGRLAGDLPVTLRQPARALAKLAGERSAPAPRPGDAATTRLRFADGLAKLGAVKLGPSPRL